MENNKPEIINNKKRHINGFIVFGIIIFSIFILGIILLSIKYSQTIKCEDTITTEQISNFDNITLTKNNIHTLFDINGKVFQQFQFSKNTDYNIEVKPQLKNYQYISCSITIKLYFKETFGSNNYYTETKTCLLNINGIGVINNHISNIDIDKNNCSYQIISVTGTMIKGE